MRNSASDMFVECNILSFGQLFTNNIIIIIMEANYNIHKIIVVSVSNTEI